MLVSDAQLEKEMRELRNAGVVQLLQDDMPAECFIIEHFDDLLKLMP